MSWSLGECRSRGLYELDWTLRPALVAVRRERCETVEGPGSRESGFAGGWSRKPARPDEAGLVGEHDELGAVSCTQLRDRPADVGADGGWAEVELLGDLVVGEPIGDLGHDLAFTVGEDVEIAAGPGLLGSGGELDD